LSIGFIEILEDFPSPLEDMKQIVVE